MRLENVSVGHVSLPVRIAQRVLAYWVLPCRGRTWGCYLQTIKSNVFDDLGFQKLLGYPLAREGKRPVGRLCVYLKIWDFRNCLGTRWRGRASGPLAAFVCSVRSCWLVGWLAS